MDENLHTTLQDRFKQVFTKSPGLAGLLFYIPYRVDAGVHKINRVSAKSMVFGLRFFELPVADQWAVVSAAILHVALRHPTRIKALTDSEMRIPHSEALKIGWLASKLVVHSALASSPYLVNASHGQFPTLDALFPREVLSRRGRTMWTMNQIYEFLVKIRVASKTGDWTELQALPGMSRWHGEQMEFTLEFLMNATGETFEANAYYSHANMGGSRLVRWLQDMDISLQDGRASEDEDRIWHQRVQRAEAGDRASGAVRSAAYDSKAAPLPWTTLLRQWMTSHLTRRSDIDMSRPGNDTLSLLAAGVLQQGAPQIVDYARNPLRGLDRIGVAVDTSGSVGTAMMTTFFTQIRHIQKALGCRLTLVCADADVYTPVDVADTDDPVTIAKRHNAIKGGGGTDFTPAVTLLNDLPNIRVIVYFTDMMGTFPEESKRPILWAAVGAESPSFKPPMGTVIYMDQYLEK